jgi:hypothetical protein
VFLTSYYKTKLPRDEEVVLSCVTLSVIFSRCLVQVSVEIPTNLSNNFYKFLSIINANPGMVPPHKSARATSELKRDLLILLDAKYSLLLI